jgi:hypothetical protein
MAGSSRMDARGIVNLKKILSFSGPKQLALRLRINSLETDKYPCQDLKWINLTIPSPGLQDVLALEVQIEPGRTSQAG